MARTLGRKEILAYGGLALGAGAIAACSPGAPTPMPEKPKPTPEPPKASQPDPTVEPKFSGARAVERAKAHLSQHYEHAVTKEKLSTAPFIYLPIAKADIPNLKITQGWFADPEEAKVSKIEGHAAIDISGPFGTTVYAPCDGYYLATLQEAKRVVSGQTVTIKDEDGKEKWIAYGGGLFIEFRTADGVEHGQLLHCSKVLVPFVKPAPRDGGGWNPRGHNLPFEEFKKVGKFYKTGEPIGAMGVSGLGIETFGPYNGEDAAPEYKESDVKTWDPANKSKPHNAHVHLALYRRDKDGNKHAERDAMAIYGWAEDYSLTGEKSMGKDHLVFADSKGVPLCAA